MSITSKPPVYDDPAINWLMSLSKAALADCVVDLMRPMQENCDSPLSAEFVAARLGSVLGMRGDRMPVTDSMRVKKRVAKRLAKKTFDHACEIARKELR